MIEKIYHFDRFVTLAVNGPHTPLQDDICLILSSKFFFFGVVVLFLICLSCRKKVRFGSREYRTEWKLVLLSAVFVAAAFAASDIIAHEYIKPLVRRLRPGYDPWIQSLVWTPAGRGGIYTFVSNHAANSFGFATLSALILRNRFYTFMIFLTGAAVCYSRIYLARHFLTDTLGGAVLGIILGFIFYGLLAVAVRNLFTDRRFRAITGLR